MNVDIPKHTYSLRASGFPWHRFRLGRLYRYDLPLLDAKTLEAFMTDGFRNARAEEIPHPKTPL